MRPRFKRSYLSSLAMFGLAAVFVYTQACSSASAASSINKGSDGVAVKGYDVVAYFTEAKPAKGKKEFQHE
jgi:hypothetical protein